MPEQISGRIVTERRFEYESSQKRIESEYGLAELVSNVRSCISQLDGMFEDKSYMDVLKIIEQGAYEIKRGFLISDRIDLQQARSLIKQYRNCSEGGCTSCTKLGAVKPFRDDAVYWCDVNEKEEDALKNSVILRWSSSSSSMTPKVKQYWEKGCEARVRKFNRTVEEVLADAGEHGLLVLKK